MRLWVVRRGPGHICGDPRGLQQCVRERVCVCHGAECLSTAPVTRGRTIRRDKCSSRTHNHPARHGATPSVLIEQFRQRKQRHRQSARSDDEHDKNYVDELTKRMKDGASVLLTAIKDNRPPDFTDSLRTTIFQTYLASSFFGLGFFSQFSQAF